MTIKLMACSITLLVVFSVTGQNSVQQNLIATSQAGTSPLYFFPGDFAMPVIQPSGFSNPAEFNVRDGLPNFFKKLKSNKKATIGYFGGSITRADNQYRVQSAKFIQSMFPGVKITGINAGVSGTGTDLGAWRLQNQVLRYNPDLVFVEFAVNGAFAEGMEGIILQIRRYNSNIDICLIYTITDGLGKIYTEGRVPEHIAKLDQLAEHYAIPSIHLGMEAALLEKQGKLLWRGDPEVMKDKIVFSFDGVHPLEAGRNLYAGAIARAMFQLKENKKPKVHYLPKSLLPDNWEDAKMLDPFQIASFNGDWEKINPSGIDYLNQFAGWFPYLLKAEKPGASFSFCFEGTMFGIFDIGGPEVGQLEIELDGNPLSMKQLNMENYVQSITEHPQKYNQEVLYLGKILIRGNVLSSNHSSNTNQ
jgi:lysophospholipase L1-like esterase